MRQLAAAHKILPSAISRKAKQENWVQDKRSAVKALSDAKLLVSTRRKATAKATPTEADIETAATIRTNIVLSHRQDGGRSHALAITMMEELEAVTLAPMTVLDLQDILSKCFDADEIPATLRRRAEEALQQVTTLESRAGVLKTLTESLSKAMAIEREAFSIGDPDPTAC